MDAEKACQENLAMTNEISEAVMKNNQIFAEKWKLTHDWINCHLEEQCLLQAQVVDLESLLGLQQTALQHCQDTIAGLEETVAQLVALVKKLEKTICQCHDWLLSPGLHYAEGEEEEVVGDLEEDEEDSLEYKMDAPSQDSYMTLPSILLWLQVVLLLQGTLIQRMTQLFIPRNWKLVLSCSWRRQRRIWR